MLCIDDDDQKEPYYGSLLYDVYFDPFLWLFSVF